MLARARPARSGMPGPVIVWRRAVTTNSAVPGSAERAASTPAVPSNTSTPNPEALNISSRQALVVRKSWERPPESTTGRIGVPLLTMSRRTQPRLSMTVATTAARGRCLRQVRPREH